MLPAIDVLLPCVGCLQTERIEAESGRRKCPISLIQCGRPRLFSALNLLRNQQVVGSNLTGGSKKSNKIK
jgi:hypothetical protein